MTSRERPIISLSIQETCISISDIATEDIEIDICVCASGGVGTRHVLPAVVEVFRGPPRGCRAEFHVLVVEGPHPEAFPVGPVDLEMDAGVGTEDEGEGE